MEKCEIVMFDFSIQLGFGACLLESLLQGKTKKLLDKEDDQVLANVSQAVEENIVSKAPETCSNDQVNCASQLLEEDEPENANETEEPRPVKKTKPSTDESHCLIELNDGLSILDAAF